MPSIRLARIDYGRYPGTDTRSPHPTLAFEVARGDETFEIPITVDLREVAPPRTDEAFIKVGRRQLAELLSGLAEQSSKWKE